MLGATGSVVKPLQDTTISLLRGPALLPEHFQGAGSGHDTDENLELFPSQTELVHMLSLSLSLFSLSLSLCFLSPSLHPSLTLSLSLSPLPSFFPLSL